MMSLHMHDYRKPLSENQSFFTMGSAKNLVRLALLGFWPKVALKFLLKSSLFEH